MVTTNRIKQTTIGTWYFKFKCNDEWYFQTNFETQEQAEQALQLQYQVLNLTTTGQKKDTGRCIRIEKGIFLMRNGKYKAQSWSDGKNLSKTSDTLEQARAFIAEHKKPRKKRVCAKPKTPKPKTPKPKTPKPKTPKPKTPKPKTPKPKTPKPKTLKPKTPKPQKTLAEKKADLLAKTQRAKKVNMAAGELNKAIAELNNRDRPLIKRPKPTIAELSQLAKQQHNPRQFYLDQLRSGAYRV